MRLTFVQWDWAGVGLVCMGIDLGIARYLNAHNFALGWDGMGLGWDGGIVNGSLLHSHLLFNLSLWPILK